MHGVATMRTSMILEQAVEDGGGELHFAAESDIVDHLDRISGKFAYELERCSGQILLISDRYPRSKDAA